MHSFMANRAQVSGIFSARARLLNDEMTALLVCVCAISFTCVCVCVRILHKRRARERRQSCS